MVRRGRRSVAASEASQRRGFAGSEESQRRGFAGSVAASEASQRRGVGGVAASGVCLECRSVGGVAAQLVHLGCRSVARRRHRSVGGSPGASQRRSVAPRRLAPFSPCADLSPIQYILCFPCVLHLKCPFLEDPLALFEQLDADGGGELSLQERNAFRFCLPNCWNDRGLWQELDEDAGLILHHFQEYTVAKYKRGVEDYAGMAGMVGLGS